MKQIVYNGNLFIVNTIIENGYPHYCITDSQRNAVTCDLNELNIAIAEMSDELAETARIAV